METPGLKTNVYLRPEYSARLKKQLLDKDVTQTSWLQMLEKQNPEPDKEGISQGGISEFLGSKPKKYKVARKLCRPFLDKKWEGTSAKAKVKLCLPQFSTTEWSEEWFDENWHRFLSTSPAEGDNVDSSSKSLASPNRRITLWQEAYQPPATITKVEKERHVVGTKVGPGKQGQGCFCSLPVHEQLADEVLEFVEKLLDGSKLPLFWIGGASGSGKSVALLQVLSQLYERGYHNILWLENTAQLAEAIAYGQQLQQSNDSQVFIAIDDPYIPAVQAQAADHWQAALDSVYEQRRDNQVELLPVVVCCGPTEQKELFRKDENAAFISLKFRPLSNAVSDEDIAVLSDWFRKRTGREPPTVNNKKALLVQIFFEWSVGESLEDFAKRFRKRITDGEAILKNQDDYNPPEEKKGYTSLIDEILALNRLYVAYPAAAIEERLECFGDGGSMLFHQLMEEHFQRLSDDDENEGYFMTHAHLANQFYTIWHGAPYLTTRRKRHLRYGIEACYTYGQCDGMKAFEPLIALSNVLREKAQVKDRIDLETAATVIRKTYDDWYEKSPPPASHLPIWIQLAADFHNADIKPPIANSARWKPISLATKIIKSTDAITDEIARICSHLLMQFKELNEEKAQVLSKEEHEVLINKVNTYLDQNDQWKGWPLLWSKLYRVVSKCLPDQEKSKFNRGTLELGYKWAGKEENASHPHWQQVWAGLPKHENYSTKNLTLDWLKNKNNYSHHSWQYVWRQYLEGREKYNLSSETIGQLIEIGREWVASKLGKQSNWVPIWSRIYDYYILQKNLEEATSAITLIKSWINEQQTSPRWPFILQKVTEIYALKEEEKLSDLPYMQQAEGWLLNEDNNASVEWPNIFENVVTCHHRHQPESEIIESLLDRGEKWLSETSSKSKCWSYAWSTAYELRSGSSNLVKTGEAWLQSSTDEQRALLNVWSKLWQYGYQESLKPIGLNILERHSKFRGNHERESWITIWKDLWDACYKRPDLTVHGQAWLEEYREKEIEPQTDNIDIIESRLQH